jgi:hypothetical protein
MSLIKVEKMKQYTKTDIEEIIKNNKTRAEMLVEQFNKKNNLEFLINHEENFSYSGF